MLGISLSSWVGGALGLMIGVVSGTIFIYLLLHIEASLSKEGTSHVRKIISELVAIPTSIYLWTKGIDKVIEHYNKDVYAIIWVISFVLIAGYPGFRWIKHAGETIGRVHKE